MRSSLLCHLQCLPGQVEPLKKSKCKSKEAKEVAEGLAEYLDSLPSTGYVKELLLGYTMLRVHLLACQLAVSDSNHCTLLNSQKAF